LVACKHGRNVGPAGPGKPEALIFAGLQALFRANLSSALSCIKAKRPARPFARAKMPHPPRWG